MSNWRSEVARGQDRSQLNIEHYRKLLLSDLDDVKRSTAMQLLAAEEAKLAEFSKVPAKPKKDQP